jgi:hypothetical protein
MARKQDGEPAGLLLALTHTRLLPYGRPVGLLLAITGYGYPMPPDNRTYTIPAEDRAYAVPAEDREYVVTVD